MIYGACSGQNIDYQGPPWEKADLLRREAALRDPSAHQVRAELERQQRRDERRRRGG
jgi:hypothetical protein